MITRYPPLGATASDPLNVTGPLTDTQLRASAVNVISIDSVHQHLHDGRYFSGGHYDAAVASAANLDILIQNGSSSTFHTTFSIHVGADCTVLLFEGTTFSAAGTSVAMSNHDRTSAKVFAGTVTHTPSVTTTGTQINGTGFAAAGTKHSASGADFGYINEFILKTSTNYLLRVTNVSGGATKVSMSVQGYQPSI